MKRLACVTLLLGFYSLPGLAADYKVGDATITLKATVTLGTAIRTRDRDPALLRAANAAAIGAVGSASGGQNSDDGNLNYARGDLVSTVLKGIGDIELKYSSYGARVRVKAWRDFTLEESNVAWGNLPSGYAPNAPLSDRGFNALAQFSGVALMDAYVYGTFAAGDKPWLAQFGQQTIPWGAPASIIGGLRQINAQDGAARARPGSLPEEINIPVLAAFSRLSLTQHLNLEAFYQFRFEPNQMPGCGTFLAYVDYVSDGCDKVLVGATNDRASLAGGVFGKRAPDIESSAGQYGLGFTYLAENLGRFGAYFASVHSRRFSLGAVKSTRLPPLPPLIPGDPGGANVQYFVEHPENVRIFTLNFQTRMPDKTALFAELTYQPNQILRLNATDLLNAFASNVAPTPLRANATATAPGGAFHGYDRYRVTQLNVGGAKPLRGVAGAAELTLGAEAALKYVHELPDPGIRRYGRSDLFGLGPVNNACAGTEVQCSNAGYVTPFSWGYRLRAGLVYPNVLYGVSLSPSAAFAHDVKGWSYDDVFSEKRKVAVLGLRAEYQKRYFAELLWTSIWSGTYNFARDRDSVVAVAGMSFQ